MIPTLSDVEARLIGCLMEKSVVTPDQYPLTLNALVNACNQKSSRDPVITLDKGVVQRTARQLSDRNLVVIEENFRSGVEKFAHRFCNTPFGELKFDAAEFAIVCLLLLRGPQTPGELRARSGRLHEFEDNTAVTRAIDRLIERDGESLLVKLPRTPGRKDSEYMHLFCGPVDVEAHAEHARAERSESGGERVTVSALAERVEKLEAEVAELRRQLASSTNQGTAAR